MAELTINDIAKLAGVGKSTVSRVLNQDHRVSEATRRKVEKVIEDVQFQPSKSARAMRGLRGYSVGIIVSRLSSTSENQALATILPLLYANQCEPIIVESQFDTHLVEEHLAFFAQRKVDGVILFAFSELDEQLLKSWRQKMVVIARRYEQISSVYYDDTAAINLLMAHLYQCGHRHIAYLGVQDSDITTGFNRHQAYLQNCAKYHISPCSLQGNLDYTWAYENVSAVLSESISALICATDNLAIGAVKYLQEQKQASIQVCGIGNNTLLRFLFPKVISIDLGFSTAGKLAVTQLFALLNQQPIQHFCPECYLIQN
ncbi:MULTISPECIES: trehalose operon repressor TreR [Rodentibacter]|uniref:trehalose operon repressor TreR n=1 Tax=Rodentibacter TaxID=1960084 RepID=UPI001CFDFA58|nr:trehalose operon repressor TreR [Rodentibacter sp. JRC1]GJI56297.1 trehalose operon repressor [Rodentibacter sp. JRC1]